MIDVGSYTRHSADEVGLPACYNAVPLFEYRRPVSADVELTRMVAELEVRFGYRPTVVFSAIRECHLSSLANPYPRAVLLSALGLSEATCLPTVHERLTVPRRPSQAAGPALGTALTAIGPPAVGAGSLMALPPVRHRPGDAGPYLTAAILACRPPDAPEVNLGIYRAMIGGRSQLRLSIGTGTDAYRIMRQWHENGQAMPATIFAGADPAFALVAAGDLTAAAGSRPDDFEIAASMLGRPVVTAGDPPAPASAPVVIRGELTARLAPEGPFGEFKGYYTEPGHGHVFEVSSVELGDAPVPYIVPGAASGIALSQLSAEIRLYVGLVRQGFDVESVRYPADGYGKYLVLVETDDPTEELLDAVMRLDRAPKMVVCGPDLRRPWEQVGSGTTLVRPYPFFRRGEQRGERVGILVSATEEGARVEF